MAKRKTEPEGPQTHPRGEVPVVGHGGTRERIRHALDAGRFPQGLILTGDRGIGKARMAGWAARALLCGEPGAPCEACPTCRSARRMEHPDLHWLFPHESPGGGSLDRQIGAVETRLAEQLEARRADALHMGAPPEAIYYLASVQRLRRLTSRAPSTGPCRVFIVTEADTLVLSDNTAGAAVNAFLKTLEEPPTGTHFILTSARAHRLPATIRSRVSELRMKPLGNDEVAAVLQQAFAEPVDGIEQAARYSGGSVLRARQRLDDEWFALRARAVALVNAAVTGDASARYAAIRDQGFKGARAEFSALLSEVEHTFIEAAEAVSGQSADVAPEIEQLLGELSGSASAARLVDGAFRAANGLRLAANNVAPMLVLHDVLRPR